MGFSVVCSAVDRFNQHLLALSDDSQQGLSGEAGELLGWLFPIVVVNVQQATVRRGRENPHEE